MEFVGVYKINLALLYYMYYTKLLYKVS